MADELGLTTFKEETVWQKSFDSQKHYPSVDVEYRDGKAYLGHSNVELTEDHLKAMGFVKVTRLVTDWEPA